MAPKPYSIMFLSELVTDRMLVVISGIDIPRARIMPLDKSES